MVKVRQTRVVSKQITAQSESRQLTPEEHQAKIDAMRSYGVQLTPEQKAEEARIYIEIAQKFEAILTKHLFIPTNEEIQAMWQESFQYPDYNTQELKELLFRMAMADDTRIAHAESIDAEFKIELDLWFMTSPKQVKTFFQYKFNSYPFLSLWSKIEKKSSLGRLASYNHRAISLGEAVSLLKQFKFQWI
jgi:hypothetical protein